MTNEYPREEWLAALSAVPEERLNSVIDPIAARLKVSPRALPQAGMGMLKMRDTALNEAFYLGEFPLATCWVSVSDEEGREVEGAAQVMDDRVERAERLALCDAVLAGRLPGWESVNELVEQGVEQRRRVAAERKAMLLRTRVDFSLLDDIGGEDD